MKKSVLVESIYSSYHKDQLQRIIIEKILPFVKSGKVDNKFNLKKVMDIRKMNKNELSEIYSECFLSKKNFFTYLFLWGEEVTSIFNIITWLGEVNTFSLEKSGIDIFKEDDGENFIEESVFLFLVENLSKYSHRIELSLPRYLTVILTDYWDEKPPGYYLEERKNDFSEYFCNFQDEALKNIVAYLELVESGRVDAGKTGKIKKGFLRDFKKNFNINEFFIKEKKFEYKKSELILETLNRMELYRISKKDNSVELLQEIVETILSGNLVFKDKSYSVLKLLTPHLKGYNGLIEKSGSFMIQIREFLKNIPRGKWVDIENIYFSMKFQKSFFEIFSRRDASYYVYANVIEAYENYHFVERTYLAKENYNELLIKPFIKNYLMLLSVFGVVELSYGEPEATLFDAGNGYLTFGDSVTQVKLTEFGEYVLGLRENFSYEEKIDNSKITFNSERLIFNLEGENVVKKIIVENIAKGIGGGKYIVNNTTVLAGVNSKKELIDKIKQFENLSNEKIPKNWEEFFKEIKSKVDLISLKDDYLVFELDKSKELLNLFLKDEQLKKISLRAEEYHILVKQDNLNKVKKRLKTLGYLNSF